MKNDPAVVNQHVEGLEGDAKAWVSEFVAFMREKYPELEEVVSFQMPTYKLGSGAARNYVAFGTGKNHFSLHSVDFDYIAALKGKLRSAGKGKGCVNVKFADVDEKPILFAAIDEIVARNDNSTTNGKQ